MIRVTALTANRPDPVSRFRVRQYIAPLADLGVEVREHYLPWTRYRRQPLASLAMLCRVPGVLASRGTDITWLRRELIPERFTLERFTGGRRIFDVDDAIWLMRDSGFSERIAARCDGVIAGNHWLAEHYRQANPRVWVVPTSVDTDVWRPAESAPQDEWVVGWTGTQSNLRFIESLEEPLAAFLRDHADARLRIVCDRRPAFTRLPAGRWEFLRWSEAIDVSSTQTMDAGLMPLEDSDWARGKCACKMLLYMAVGRPAVVSPVGVNNEILARGAVGLVAKTDADWYDALKQLYENRELGARMGAAGRKVTEEHYSVKVNVGKLAAIFREVVAG
jgi:glycosyltransferase involved in cell wall biosynthesis